MNAPDNKTGRHTIQRKPGESMNLPPEMAEMLKKLSRVGQPLLVGGCVRDWLLGLDPIDFDVEVFGIDYSTLANALRAFGPTDVVGKQFGVVKVRARGLEYDFSLPRKEIKSGAGHRGFDVRPDPNLSIETAALRRDFTLNAISYDPAGTVVDPLGGLEDLKRGRLRHSSGAFAEDPLRVLRAFQLAARFDLDVAPETADLCRSIRRAFSELPRERIWGEWEKWAAKSTLPSRGIRVLEETGWMEFFPEIAALRGVPQDTEWHPEGDVFTHTLHCLDSLAAMGEWRSATASRRRDLMLAVLAHDFGKAVTTEQVEKDGVLRWVSPRHEVEGGKIAVRFMERIGAPKSTRQFVVPLIENHLYHIHMQDDDPRLSAIRRLARRLAPATIDDLCLVMLADVRGRPPKAETDHPGITGIRETARRVKLEDSAPKPIIMGRHLLAEGIEPGPHMGKILEAVFEAQLDGAFSTEEEGIRFLREFLKPRK